MFAFSIESDRLSTDSLFFYTTIDSLLIACSIEADRLSTGCVFFFATVDSRLLVFQLNKIDSRLVAFFTN